MNVHIADDSNILIEGFQALFNNTGINIVGISRNGFELISWLKINKNTADIIILDVDMPEKNGIEVVEYFNRNKIDQKVIIVSEFIHTIFIKKTVGEGAKGYISKSFASSCILEALIKVKNGGTFFSLDVQELLIKQCLNFEYNPNSEFATSMLEKSLSKQEINILLLEMQKYKPQEISEELKISQSTIRSYRARIREKLNIPKIIGFSKRLAFLKGIGIEK